MLARRTALPLVAGGREGASASRWVVGLDGVGLDWTGRPARRQSAPHGSWRLEVPTTHSLVRDFGRRLRCRCPPRSLDLRWTSAAGPAKHAADGFSYRPYWRQWRRQDRSPKPLRNLPPCRIENTSHNNGRQIGSRRAADHLFRSTCPKWRGTFWMTDGRSVRA